MTAPDEQPTIPPTHDPLDAVIADYLEQVEAGATPGWFAGGASFSEEGHEASLLVTPAG